MATKTYRYSGPLSGVTLDDGTEVILQPSAEIPLPPENEYVKTLVAQKLLTEVEVPKEPAPVTCRKRPAAPAEAKQPEVEEATHAS